MTKTVDAMIDSLAKDQHEYEYRIPRLRSLDEQAALFEQIPDALDPADKEAILAEREALSARTDPPSRIPFLFVKLRKPEWDRAQDFFLLEKQKALNALLRERGPARKEALLLGIENDLLLAVATDMDAEYETKKALVDVVLALEGKTEEWANEVPDDHPDLALSEGQEERLALTDDLSQDEYYRRLEVAEAKRAEWVQTKRENIIEAQQNEVAARRTQLMTFDTEKLASSVVVREMEREALIEATERLKDFQLYYAVCSPTETADKRHGKVVRQVPRRVFPTIDDLTALREGSEGEQDLYAWLWGRYQELQIIQTAGDIGRVARSDAFPAAL